MMFNDPLYALNIFAPNFFTMIASTFFTASFFGVLFHYWLRSVQVVKDTPDEQAKKEQQKKKEI